MKLLLDTHIWIWSLVEPERLSRRVARELVAPANEIWLSPISVWEAMLLAERGRIVVAADARAWVEEMLRATPAREAPLTHDVALHSREVELPHADPADRFLAATAQVHGLTLVTADGRLLRNKEIDTLAN
ncbi:MAG: type II toxin-antitoxin system VapC family toxin [Gemmatimonadaceae bacterium]